MMEKLQNLSLGQEGNSYVETCLRGAGKGLCSELLGLPINSGSSYAPLPEGVTISRGIQTETGGLMTSGQALDWLEDHCQTLFLSHPHSLLVFQDVWGAKEHDEAVKQIRSSKFFSDSEVYVFSDNTDIHQNRIKNVIRDIGGFLLIGAFISTSGILVEFLTDQNVDREIIKTLAANTVEILVGAYDREGFVVWRRA